MLSRLTATITATFVALCTLAGTALALPGEGYGIDPYGIPTTDGSRAAADPVAQIATGLDLSPLVFAAVIVATAALMALVGYLAGTTHQRRLAPR